MEHIAISLFGNHENQKELHHMYIESLTDLKRFVEEHPDLRPILKCTDDWQRMIRDRLHKLPDQQQASFQAKPDRKVAEKFNQLPGNFLTLNGVNAILGKRGTGKSTFAYVQVIDAYLEYFKELILSFLKYDTNGKQAFDQLTKQIIVVFGFREVLQVSRLNALVEERAKRFVDCYLKSVTSVSQAEVFRSYEALATLLNHQLFFCFVNSSYEFKAKLAELSLLKLDPDGQHPFAVLLDDPGFIFNAIDSTIAKSEFRFIGRHCTQLVQEQGMVVVLVDSFKHFYEDKEDFLSCYLPGILFSCCSDCMVTSVVENRFYRVAQVKSSKVLLNAH